MRKNIKNKISEIDDTADFLFPHIEFDSNKRVYLEGSEGVIEYNSSAVRLNCGEIIVKFLGDELAISSAAEGEIEVQGNIAAVEFISC